MNTNVFDQMKKHKFKILAAIFSIMAISLAIFFYKNRVLSQAAINLLGQTPKPEKTDRVLVFSPHPDDETIASGGYIATATRKGASVWIALVTDGNKHHLESKRYKEFRKATSYLGVPNKNLFFLNYPDGRLIKQDPNKVRNSLKEIIDKVDPTIILAPHPRDDHQDHYTTGRIFNAMQKDKDIVIYQYLVHYPDFPEPYKYEPDLYLMPPLNILKYNREWDRFMLPQEIEDLKMEAVLQYKTQLKFLPLRELLYGMVRKNELFSQPDKPIENGE